MAKSSKIWVPCFCHSSGRQNRTQNFHNSTPQGIKQKHLHKWSQNVNQFVYQSNKPHQSASPTLKSFCKKAAPLKTTKKNHLSALILQCLQVYWTWCPVHRIVVDSARFFGAFHGMRSNLTGLNSVRFQLLHFIPTDWSSYGQLYRKPEKKGNPAFLSVRTTSNL